MTDISLLRDVQVAEDMRKKAMLGYFDLEFTAYGTAYWQDGEVHYRISENEDNIYHFAESALSKDIYCANVRKETKRCAVPSGTKAEKSLLVKYKTAQALQSCYPRELFAQLSKIAEMARENTAYALLAPMRAQLEGIFDGGRLRYYAELVDYCYSALTLSRAAYDDLRAWIVAERRNMEDDFVEKDLFEKTFYGIAYSTGGGRQYLENTLRGNVYRRKYELEQQGALTSPLFSQTYWYNHKYRLKDAKGDYLARMKAVIDDDYWTMLQALLAPNAYAAEIDSNALISAANAMSPMAAATMERYLYRWRLRVK